MLTRPTSLDRAGAALLLTLLLCACATQREQPLSSAQQHALTFNQRASQAFERGEYRDAARLYSAALTLAESMEDTDAIAANLSNLALVHQRLREFAVAQKHLDRLLAHDPPPTPDWQARAAARKALIYLDTGDTVAARHWADTANAMCRTTGCTSAATIINLRAVVAFAGGDFALAAELAQQGIGANSAPHQATELANAWRTLGRADMALSNPARAAKALARALALDKQLGLPDRVALDLTYAGDNEALRGEARAAEAFFRRAESAYRAAGNMEAARRLETRIQQAK